VPILLGLAWAFDRLHVPDWHQIVFPIGLSLLVGFSSLGYLFPRSPDLDPFYFWTKGPAKALALIGITGLAAALLWTAAVLVIYALDP
jgi:hypothetical protein